MSGELPIEFEGGAMKVETTNKMDCEYREVLDDNSLDPCNNDADYAVTTADYGEPTRVRYCNFHIWNGVSEWMERNDDG